MRIGALLAVAVSLAGGLLAYRVVTLERRIDALDKQLGQPQATANARPNKLGYEQRLLALEKSMQAVRDDLRALEEAEVMPTHGALDADKAGSEKRILSVVEREQERIRDRQLEFQRARWLEWREAALDDFADRFGLSPWQTEQVHRSLTDEIDKMVEILRRPQLLENPEQVANDWKTRLEATDDAVRRVLDPAQIGPWNQAREAERKALWPWLPNGK